ncbi:hypothetical protein LSCM1_00736 [Leishmania martiniquensis]|uniref:Uncharacterized protein n=1 Tax=Leishmania martiniquensis TaxID=1580590 RepID=A0A836GTR5_9TRYP|nr:hypothetical protein LSCM1_00736 [Leishmania martiniquensis]
MHIVESSRLWGCSSCVARAVLEYARPEDANGPSRKPVNSDVWYASMFMYPNHWQAGSGGALPLPGSPYRSFPTRSLLWEARDHIVSVLTLLFAYFAVALCFPSAVVDEQMESF